MWRNAQIVSPSVNSATASELLPVVRATLMPSARAVSMSRLSTPTPHLCSSLSRFAARSTSPPTATWPEIA